MNSTFTQARGVGRFFPALVPGEPGCWRDAHGRRHGIALPDNACFDLAGIPLRPGVPMPARLENIRAA